MGHLISSLRLGKLPALRSLNTSAGRVGCILSGSGPATLLMFNGAGVTLEGWRGLYPGIEKLGQVLAWNRLGVGGSDAPRSPQTGEAVVATLRELLAQLQLKPPYVLVGHSLGGLFANLYARLHPGEVAAVMLLEAAHPRDREVLSQHETQFARGLSKLFSLPQVLFRRNLHSEIECLQDTVRQLGAAGPFPAVPLAVVTGGKTPPGWLMSPAAVGARRAHQQDLARLSARGEQVIAQHSGHFPQLTEAPLVLRTLEKLIA